jgi:hypothetical protein
MPFFAVSFISEYVSNLINGVHDPVKTAFEQTSSTMRGMSGVASRLSIPIVNTKNTILSLGIDPFGPGLTLNYSQRVGDWTFGGSAGTGGFAGLNITYDDGKFMAGTSMGVGADGSTRLGGGVGYGGARVGLTHFGGKDPQWNWLVGYSRGDFRFAMSNDAWVGGDKFRTAAIEFGVGDYSLGANIYTTAPKDTEYGANPSRGTDDAYRSMWGENPYSTYSEGDRVYAGLYAGYNNGFSVSRTGVDAAFVQDFAQNGVHKWLSHSPYFNTNRGPATSLFGQWLAYNPWSLY